MPGWSDLEDILCMQTNIIKLRFGRFANLLTIWTVTLPDSPRAPFMALSSAADGFGETPFPLDVRDFQTEFKDMMDGLVIDEILPCDMWVIKWGERYGMAAAGRIIHPNCNLLVNGERVGPWICRHRANAGL